MIRAGVAQGHDGGCHDRGESRRAPHRAPVILVAERQVVPPRAVPGGRKDVDAGRGKPAAQSGDTSRANPLDQGAAMKPERACVVGALRSLTVGQASSLRCCERGDEEVPKEVLHVDLDVEPVVMAASLGRSFTRWFGLQFDAFVGQVGLSPNQGLPTKGLRAADSLPTAPRATSTAGLTASGRMCLCSLPNPLLPSRTGAGGEIYVVGGAGAYFFSEHSTGNRSTRLGASAGPGAPGPRPGL